MPIENLIKEIKFAFTAQTNDIDELVNAMSTYSARATTPEAGARYRVTIKVTKIDET